MGVWFSRSQTPFKRRVLRSDRWSAQDRWLRASDWLLEGRFIIDLRCVGTGMRRTKIREEVVSNYRVRKPNRRDVVSSANAKRPAGRDPAGRVVGGSGNLESCDSLEQRNNRLVCKERFRLPEPEGPVRCQPVYRASRHGLATAFNLSAAYGAAHPGARSLLSRSVPSSPWAGPWPRFAVADIQDRGSATRTRKPEAKIKT